MIPISKPYIGLEEKALVMEVLESGMLAQGTKVAQLEECFAKICGVKHAIATTSGTTALHLSLMANGIGPGDEVITTPFTFIASVNSILYVGAKPVFVDVDPETFNLDPAMIETVITPRTKAILAVHLFGYMCDMGALQAIADRYGLKIIEDACQAVGAFYSDGKKAGSFGTGAFSLYATKNIMAGEGGMITTNDDAVAERCRMMRNHGMKQRYYHEIMGYNFRMSDLHAAIGLAQINRLEDFTAARVRNASYYNQHIHSVITPKVKPGYGHVWHQYTIRVERDRNAAVNQLNDAGIGTGIFYPVPAHQQVYIKKYLGEIHLPKAETLAQQVISIPVHPQLSQAELDAVVQGVNQLCL